MTVSSRVPSSTPIETSLGEGIRAAVPIALGYLPIGMAYGVLARQAGFATTEVVAMSLIVFAGSSQFIAAAMWASGLNAWAIVFTTFLVNLRHLLMSAALATPLRRIPRFHQALLAFWITDESFAISSTSLVGRKATASYMAGLQLTAYLVWATSSLVGAALSPIAAGVAHLGIDYALPAMFIALLVMQVKDRAALVVALLSGTISILMVIHAPGNLNVIAATLVAATVGMVITR